VESPVQPARLSNPHHRSGGVGIKNPAAFPATASPDLGKVCFDASFHVVIIIRLRSNFKFLCGFPASLNVCSTAFTIARNKVKLGVERATVPARAIQLPPRRSWRCGVGKQRASRLGDVTGARLWELRKSDISAQLPKIFKPGTGRLDQRDEPWAVITPRG